MMSTKEALEKSHIKDTANKNTLNLLVDYANGVTGNSDTNIGDAIKTLCDGYEQGGEEVESGTITIEKTSKGFTLPTTKQHEIYILSVEDPKEFVSTEEWTYYMAVVWKGIFSLTIRKYTNGNSATDLFNSYTINADNSITIITTGTLWRAGIVFNWKAF